MRDVITILEAIAQPKEVEIFDLAYKESDLQPVMSAATMRYHYGKLAHSYAERYNKGQGDKNFNFAGAFLHNMFFPQFRRPRPNNKPNGPIAGLINTKFGSWEDFKKEFAEAAMKIQGSGWIYLARDGSIKTIPNHQVRNDILILVDWWEHAWSLDYQSDKKAYLDNIWRIMDWTVLNTRWGRAYSTK